MYSILELYANNFSDLMNASIKPDDVYAHTHLP